MTVSSRLPPAILRRPRVIPGGMSDILRQPCLEAMEPAARMWMAGEGLGEFPAAQYSADWVAALRQAADKLAEKLTDVLQMHRRLGQLRADVATLRKEFIERRDSHSLVVPVSTLAPEPLALLREIPVVVRPTEDGFLATLFDANIGMTGDTQEEAVENLKALLVDVFEQLEREENQLGPGPQRQLATLRSFIKRQD